MQKDLLSLGDRAAELLDLWATTSAVIYGVGVAREASNAHTPGVSVEEIVNRLNLGLASISRLRGVDPANLALIASRLPSIKSGLDAIQVQAGNTLAALEPWQGATSSDTNGHLTLQLQHAEKGTFGFDLGTPLASLLQQANALLEQAPYVALTVGEKSAPLLVGAAAAVAEKLEDAKSAAESATADLERGKAIVEDLNALAASGRQLLQQVQDLLTGTTSQKSNVDGHAAEIEQKLARVREVSKDADSLQQRVTAFTAQFEAFDSQMKGRLEQFASFEAATKESQRLNEEREATIDAL